MAIMDIKIHFLIIFLLVALSSFFNCHDVGDPCPGGNPGVCTRIQDCTLAIKNIQLRKNPQICSFQDQEPIICCSDKKLKANKKSTLFSLSRISDTRFTTLEELLMFKKGGNSDGCPPIIVNPPAPKTARKSFDSKISDTRFTTLEELLMFKKGGNSDGCPPIIVNPPAPKTARKSFDKCLDYQKKYLYPCVESPLVRQNKMRANFCTWSPESLISNGENAARGEFPHMALLGFGTTNIDWKCGGTILSEKFVLTAAHCTKIPNRGPVTKIKIGILNRSEPDSKTNLYNVLKIHVHKGYHSPLKYNDIALLETDREMLLYPFALPACLHDGSLVNDTEVIGTGWGTTKPNTIAPADILQKVFLHKFQDSECIRFHKYLNHRNTLGGFDSETQICFGDKMSKNDTCPGDSGGPVQIRHPKVYCMYLVLGVTSYGRSCGLIGEPGVYTRVSHYLPWIESIVWP